MCIHYLRVWHEEHAWQCFAACYCAVKHAIFLAIYPPLAPILQSGEHLEPWRLVLDVYIAAGCKPWSVVVALVAASVSASVSVFVDYLPTITTTHCGHKSAGALGPFHSWLMPTVV